MVVVDEHGRGAGAVRNEGLSGVTTGAVVFLDADDWVEPTFAEECLKAWDGNRYLYTDWFEDEAFRRAPKCAWTTADSEWHCITALVPTAWAREVGGFDETLPGGEDTDFWLKLIKAGHCGRRVPHALFHYSPNGERSHAFKDRADYDEITNHVFQRYRGIRMACCGQDEDQKPVNEYSANTILVRAGWEQNSRQRGLITGNLYPRTGHGALLWVDERDAAYSPQLFQRVQEGSDVPFPAFDDEFQEMVRAITEPFQNRRPQSAQPAASTRERVLELWGAPKAETVEHVTNLPVREVGEAPVAPPATKPTVAKPRTRRKTGDK